MRRFTVIDNFIIPILILTIVKSTTGIQSSICPGCDKHNLTCPSGQQIDISSAYQGFTLANSTCTGCKDECCRYYKHDCLEHYQGLEYGPLMRCCGKTDCTLTGSVGSLSYCKLYHNYTLNEISSYSQISYRCVNEPTITPSSDSGWKEMTSLQIVIDGMKPYYCSYAITSVYYNFFQTNTKGANFLINWKTEMECNVHYSVHGYSMFTTQPNTDVFIVLSGYYRIHTYNSPQSVTVKYKCSNTPEPDTTMGPMESTTMASAKTTEPLLLNKVTEKTDDFLEEETNTQTREEYENVSSFMGEDSNERLLVGSLVGSIAGLFLLILLVGVIVVVIKKRQKRFNHDDGVVNGLENPGYEVSNPDNLSTMPTSDEINVSNDNSTVEYVRDLPDAQATPDSTYDNAITISNPPAYETLN